MSYEVKMRVVEPFFTTKPAGKGTGLGLATEFGIIKQASGFLAIESEVGVGTVMTVLMPPMKPPAETGGDRDIAQPPKPYAKVRSGKVLVVDDDAAVRHIVVQALKMNGFDVLEAADGREALELFDNSLPIGDINLILTDSVMPHYSGTELADLIYARNPHQKVIIMSGYDESQPGSGTQTKTRIPFIAKPFRIGELLSKIEFVLGR